MHTVMYSTENRIGDSLVRKKSRFKNMVLFALLLYILILMVLISLLQVNQCQNININNNYDSPNDQNHFSYYYYTNLLCTGTYSSFSGFRSDGETNNIDNSVMEKNVEDWRIMKRTIEMVGNRYFSNSEKQRTIPFLIDLTNFEYLIDNDICGTKDVYMLIMIHTAPKNFEERMAIRTTWASTNIFKHISIKLTFLLAAIIEIPFNSTTSGPIQLEIERENSIYGDIIQGNFIDAYRNLTYKNLMGKRWAAERCPQALYILKADDDMFVDMFQLVAFLEDEFPGPSSDSQIVSSSPSQLVSPPPDLLMCYLFPSSPAVSDETHANAKWLVSSSEYASDTYPPYCSGRAYITTPRLALRLWASSLGDRYFWIDDVYVTGILPARLKVTHMEVNDLYNLYDPVRTLEWAANGAPEPLKQIFAYAEHGHFTFPRLWNKTMSQHRNYNMDGHERVKIAIKDLKTNEKTNLKANHNNKE
ncbi:unnamed protein product [Gordionus sp. m RMFG-2023]|uniref:beta-1,3-galactosyltransferase brn-like isoform X2 n=1 Tax=Gordionus sp. m RMFG-2023 TaxID=3053472 RepID=UPI0030E2174A